MSVINEYRAPTICSLKLSLSDGFAVMRPDPLLPSSDSLKDEIGDIPSITPPDPIGTDTNLTK